MSDLSTQLTHSHKAREEGTKRAATRIESLSLRENVVTSGWDDKGEMLRDKGASASSSMPNPTRKAYVEEKETTNQSDEAYEEEEVVEEEEEASSSANNENADLDEY